MPGGALEGVKVLDISEGIAGPFCARFLADFGADVIKIEKPHGGDILRSLGPFAGDDPHPEKSLFFLLLNLNKRGITLDLGSAAGRTLFTELARDADVVIEGFKPGYLASLGLDYDSLARINPNLIMTSITPFGQTGPYAQYQGEEIVAYALGSIMSISGTKDREPLKHGGFQAQYEGGLNAAAITATALLSQQLTGEGQHIDVSITDCVASTMVMSQTFYSFVGAIQGRREPTGTLLNNPMPCSDGYVLFQPGGGATWEDVASFFSKPELLEPRFANDRERMGHGAELDAILLDAVKGRGKRELFQSGSDWRMLFGMVQDPQDLAECPQLAARGFYVEVDHPVIGRIQCAAVPFNMSGTPYLYREPAPLLGQHNEEVFCGRLGLSRQDLARLRALDAI